MAGIFDTLGLLALYFHVHAGPNVWPENCTNISIFVFITKLQEFVSGQFDTVIVSSD